MSLRDIWGSLRHRNNLTPNLTTKFPRCRGKTKKCIGKNFHDKLLNLERIMIREDAWKHKSGSSDWTRTSSVTPVISGIVKTALLFINILTIIIVFLWFKCKLKTISCCRNHLTVCILPCFHYQHDVVVVMIKVIDIKKLVIL